MIMLAFDTPAYIDSGMDPMKENLVGSVTIILVVWKTLIEERGNRLQWEHEACPLPIW